MILHTYVPDSEKIVCHPCTLIGIGVVVKTKINKILFTAISLKYYFFVSGTFSSSLLVVVFTGLVTILLYLFIYYIYYFIYVDCMQKKS